MWKTFWPQGFGDHPKLQHLLGGWRIWLPNNFTTPHEPISTHRLRYGRFDNGYHQHTSPTHSYNLMALFFYSDQSLVGVCAEFDCDRLYCLHILISLRLPASCSISSSPPALYIATNVIILKS